MSVERIVRFRDRSGDPTWGVVVGDLVHVVGGDFATTGTLLEHGRDAIERAASTTRGDRRPLSSVLEPDTLLSPITERQQFICQAVNYREHAIEAGFGPAGLGANVFFRKASSCLTSARAQLVRPRDVRLLDYELELGLVLARDVRRPTVVTWENLAELVAGVVITNDVSARDIQVPEGQFFKGKSFRTFGPTGPFLCLLGKDEIARIPELVLTLRVDGEERQRGRASDMIYAPPETLTELSRVMDLDAGDLIATGTPAGVALRIPNALVARVGQLLPDATRWSLFKRMQARSRRYLEPGAMMEATIRTDDGAIDLGTMRNRIEAEPNAQEARSV